jgi:alpha-tubulin suppressor-like RCC1 family protein
MSLRFAVLLTVMSCQSACSATSLRGEDAPSHQEGDDAGTHGDVTLDASVDWQREGVVSVSSSARTLCAVTRSGRLACWGRDEALGLLGDGDRSAHGHNLPKLVGSASDWTRVSSGPYMHCAWNRARETWCWGHAAAPGFGDPALAQSVYAEPTRTPLGFAQLALGKYHACGLSEDGLLSCWGDNTYGQLGVPELPRSDRPRQVDARRYQSVAVGQNHSCALDVEGALWCFGRNYDGELGQALPETLALPTRVGVDADWLELSCAAARCCAGKRDRSVWCWGEGEAPSAIDRDAVQLRVFADGVCIVASDGTVRCGDELLASVAPQELVGGLGYRCLRTNDTLTCRGDELADALGRGVSGDEPRFVPVDAGWSQLAVRADGGCGITQDARLRCWGGAWGAAPQQLGDERGWSSLALSETSGCAIRAARLFCWQGTELGEVSVAGESWLQVAVGEATCARSAADALYCWSPAGTPVRVEGAWTDVSVSAQHVTAVRADGTLWAWDLGAAPARLGLGSSYRSVLSTSSGDRCALDADGMAQCTLDDGQSLAPLSAARGYTELFDMAEGVCLARPDRSLDCFVRGPAGGHHAGHGWTQGSGYGGDATLPLPAGPITSLSGGWDLRCVLRASGERLCAGRRRHGSFGDGVDEAAPSPVLPRI